MAIGFGPDGSLTVGTNIDLGGINTGLNNIEKSFRRFSRLSKSALGISALVKFGMSALEAASDLQEVQNVVDVSFRSLDEFGNVIEDDTYKIENFSKSCVELYGISELTAKKTAGSFAAMGHSMGLTMDEATSMAVQLTALSADFASFYNLQQEYARTAMAAVYTGETETLKRYGIVITEANLQEYAYSLGIEESVKKMSAREKLLLRYQYIMKTTAAMQGDFQRTQKSWANQLRVLKERWNQFLIVLGNGMVTVLTPVLQGLNELLTATINFSNTLGAMLTKIFGIKWQKVSEQSGTIVDSAEDITDAEDDIADAIEASTKAAEKALGPYDKLNVIRKETAKASDDGIDDASLLAPDFDSYKVAEGPIDEVNKKLKVTVDTLFGLGRYLNTTMVDILEGIDWDSVYEKAGNFGTGLAEFLNGLITPELFGDVGKTIASSLNTVIKAAVSFETTLDWYNVGESLAASINNFFKTFDFEGLAEGFNEFVQGLTITLASFLSNIEWDTVFSGIADFFTNLDDETLAILFGLYMLKKSLKKVTKDVIVESMTGAAASAGTAIAEWLAAHPIVTESLKGGILGALSFEAAGNLTTEIMNALGIGSGMSFNEELEEIWGGILDGSLWDGLFGDIKDPSAMWDEMFGIGKNIPESPYLKQVKTLKEEADKLNTSLSTVKNTLDEKMTNIEGQSAYIKQMADAYYDLSQKADLTPEDITQLKSYRDQLLQFAPEMINNINSITGAWEGTRAKLAEGIEAQLKSLKIQAFKDALIEAYQQEYEAEKAAQAAQDSLDELQSNYEKAKKRAKQDANDTNDIFTFLDANIFGGGLGLAKTEEDIFKEIMGMTEKQYKETVKGYEKVIDTHEKAVEQREDIEKQFATTVGEYDAELTEAQIKGSKNVTISREKQQKQSARYFSQYRADSKNTTSKVTIDNAKVQSTYDKVGASGYNAAQSITTAFGNINLADKLQSPLSLALGKVSQFVTDTNSKLLGVNDVKLKANTSSAETSVYSGDNSFLGKLKSKVSQFTTTLFANTANAESVTTSTSNSSSFYNKLKGYLSSWTTNVSANTSNAINATTNPNNSGSLLYKLASTLSNFTVGLNVTKATTGLESWISSVQTALAGIKVNLNASSTSKGVTLAGAVASILPKIKIPFLAKGGVIPANSPFMAVLGDQKHGTNIEAPLDTIIDAMNIALDSRTNSNDNGSREIVLQISGREILRAVVDENNKQKKMKGVSSLA